MTRDQFIAALIELFEHDGKIHDIDLADASRIDGGVKVTTVDGDSFTLAISTS
jgi:hypothetical protein